MSKHPKFELERAQELAAVIYELLAPAAERLEIAGSVARRAPQVSDIEFVMVPKLDIWWAPVINSHIHIVARKMGWQVLQDGPKAKRLEIDGWAQLDLFVTTREQWGVIKTLRTGPAELSKALVTPKQQGGLLPSHLRVKDGRLWAGDEALPTPEERDFFEQLSLAYLPPHKRDVLLSRLGSNLSDGGK